MSFDDYAKYIYQKHRLAVALAIIKSKPPNVKTEKYLDKLKSKIDATMDDDDFSVQSDDFLMGDDDEMNDSVTILKAFDPEFINNDFDLLTTAREEPPTLPETTNISHISENLSQITYYNSQAECPNDLTDNIHSQEDHNINQKSNIEVIIPKNVISERFNNRKTSIDQNTVIENKSILNKTCSKENSNNIATLNNYEPVTSSHVNMDETYYDSQKTQLYSVHGFTQNNTHYSPSQDNIVLPNKYLYGLNNKNASHIPNKNITEENNTATVSMNVFNDNETQFVDKENNSNSKIDENVKNREEFEYMQTMKMFCENNDGNFDDIQCNTGNLNSGSNETMNNFAININKNIDNNNIHNTTHFTKNIDENFDNTQFIEDNVLKNSFPTSKVGENSVNIDDETVRFGQNKEITYSKNIFEKTMDIPKATDINQYTNIEKPNQNSDKDSQLATIAFGSDSSELNKVRREAEEEYEPEEVISYKFLEEFNKVKSFLKRQNRRMSCEGYSTDSGYKSDSQRSSYRSALQLSGNGLNQSGCCLFNHIIHTPLVASTRDITNEIAQVLGLFVDRLHEEEKYPSFIEDLLETVDLLLRQIYEGESSEDSGFLKKDEHIQRILLLNKSIHIQKHTIEKITNILESFHSKITEPDSTYELSNIEQIENITYIFHLLEILLKKYLKNREMLSQSSTQNSQDCEKVFKKSSISEMWRKKWNPSQPVPEGSREKKCFLKSCSEILNRIVVDCVSSYSLVTYSALKCFNSMQT